MPTNPRNANQSLTWSMIQTHANNVNWHDECDGAVARSNGYAHSGEATARIHWGHLSILIRRGPRRPWKSGDPLFWDGRQGHIATAADDLRYVYTTDLRPDGHSDPANAGRFHYTLLSEVHRAWGLPFLGSAPAAKAFPHGNGITMLPPADVASWPFVSMAALAHSANAHTPSGDVARLQGGLMAAGYMGPLPGGRGAGYYGPLTHAAVAKANKATGFGGITLVRYIGTRGKFVATP
jgi:hypothetical protein